MLLQLVIVWKSARVVLGKWPEKREEEEKKGTSTPLLRGQLWGPASPCRGEEGGKRLKMTPTSQQGEHAKGLLPSAGSRREALEGSSGPGTSLWPGPTHPRASTHRLTYIRRGSIIWWQEIVCHHDISALNNPHIKPLVLFLHGGFAGRGWQLWLLEDRKGRRQAVGLWGPEVVTPEAPSHETHHTQGLNAIGHLSQGSSSL